MHHQPAGIEPGGSLRRDPPHQTNPTATAPDRIPELDALRGLAAAAVVLFHSRPGRLPLGWAAVDLFFVLSGFLITSIILRHGSGPGFLRCFYVRRGLRVWPQYFLTLGVFVALVPFLYRPYNWQGLPYVLTFTQGLPVYWGGNAPVFTNYLGHAWTLAVEEQFYLLWPPLVLIVGLRRGRVAALALACVAGSAWARARGMNVALLAARGDGLALGGLLAALLSSPGLIERRSGWLVGLFSAVSVASVGVLWWISGQVGLTTPRHVPTWPGLTILTFGTLFFGLIGLTTCLSGRRWLAPLRFGPLRELGQYSFGLYLLHHPIYLLSGDVARSFGRKGQPFWREAPTLALCVGLAWLSWRYFETPILRLKDRFPYRSKGSKKPASHAAMNRVES